jgi:uncharacterized protein
MSSGGENSVAAPAVTCLDVGGRRLRVRTLFLQCFGDLVSCLGPASLLIGVLMILVVAVSSNRGAADMELPPALFWLAGLVMAFGAALGAFFRFRQARLSGLALPRLSCAPERGWWKWLFAACLAVLVLDWFQTAVLRVFHAWPVPEDPITLVLNKTTGWLLWLAVLEIVFLGPISEELLYRGLLMGRFRGHGYVALGMITSAAVFMISHGDPHQYIDLFGAGLLLAWLYHRTGSLWPPVALHMLNNGWFAMHAIRHLKS